MSQIFDTVSTVKEKVRFGDIRIESRVFQLFSKVTYVGLIVCSMLITLQAYLGDHIKCILPPSEDVRKEALNQYCYITGTYTLPSLFNRTVGTEVPHPGVGPRSSQFEEEKRHLYYQWIPFVLFLQALSFRIPHWIWKSFEGGMIKKYCKLQLMADDASVTITSRSLKPYDPKVIRDKDYVLARAAQYFFSNRGHNQRYGIVYMLCEILNFIIVVVNICETDRFLGNEFSIYGHEVVQFIGHDPMTRMDPMNRVFPKVTKCEFHKYGPSGNIIKYDVMCVLALNIMSEKIYVILWFWFIIIAIFGGLAILYRIATMIIPVLRMYRITVHLNPDDRTTLNSFATKLEYYDWFLLEKLACNSKSLYFGELVHHIAKLWGDEEYEQSARRRLEWPDSFKFISKYRPRSPTKSRYTDDPVPLKDFSTSPGAIP